MKGDAVNGARLTMERKLAARAGFFDVIATFVTTETVGQISHADEVNGTAHFGRCCRKMRLLRLDSSNERPSSTNLGQVRHRRRDR
jgi:hypothetical protein